MTAESPETNPDTDSKEDLQQKAGWVETTQSLQSQLEGMPALCDSSCLPLFALPLGLESSSDEASASSQALVDSSFVPSLGIIQPTANVKNKPAKVKIFPMPGCTLPEYVVLTKMQNPQRTG